MLREDLIALGLHSGQPSTSPDGKTIDSTSVERLLTMLRDVIAVVELQDDGMLRACVERCRASVSQAKDVATIQKAVDTCAETSGKALARMDRHLVEQKKEIASLLKMVQEALAIASGHGQSFNTQFGNSMERFEALARIDDVRQLKAELVREVATLRETVSERQKVFEGTLQNFNHRVQALERQLTMTREEATLDPLTRVLNRGGFDRVCRQWLTTENLQFVLAMVDVDNFKRINDVHGHVIGDRALTAVAQVLKASVRQDRDVGARIGGDEFALLIADLSLPQAESRLRMLAQSLADVKLETANGAPLALTLSCGLAEHSAGDTVESLMERADRALYEAKNLGKNRVVGNVKPTLRELRKHSRSG
jgi:diguanylate cyclase (GGDEF)-like protein